MVRWNYPLNISLTVSFSRIIGLDSLTARMNWKIYHKYGREKFPAINKPTTYQTRARWVFQKLYTPAMGLLALIRYIIRFCVRFLCGSNDVAEPQAPAANAHDDEHAQYHLDRLTKLVHNTFYDGFVARKLTELMEDYKQDK